MVAKHFDFVSVHVYPGRDKIDQAITALAVYDIGKPLVVEETFSLNCTIEEMDQFVDGGKDRVDGWISHYFGHTIEEHASGAEPVGTAPDAPFDVAVADFLKYWRDKGKEIAGTSPEAVLGQASPPREPEVASPDSSPAADGLGVRGSVEQIHIINAQPNSEVAVRGPRGLDVTASTDERGGLVVRDVPAGDGYAVTVEGSDLARHEVRVLSREQHPDTDFYASQVLAPTDGYVETRDGTLLSYRAVLPDPAIHGPGPYGLVITYSGYQPGLKTGDAHQNTPFEKFSELGYAVVGVNMRGSGCSGGAFDFMEPLTWLDGYDVVETFAAQEWVDRVALGDQSWPGLTQLFVASTQPPSLDAIIAGSVVGDFYRDVFYPGGIQNVGFGHIWASGRDVENAAPSSRKEVNARIEIDPVCAANQSLRGQNVSLLEMIQAHPYDGDFWKSRSAEPLVAKITVPILLVVSWQDAQVGSRAATLYERFPADKPVRLIGVNGFHQYWSGAVWEEVVEFVNIYLGDVDEAEIAAYEARNDFVALLESDATGEVRGRYTLSDFAAADDGKRLMLGTELTPDDSNESSTSSTFTRAPSCCRSCNLTICVCPRRYRIVTGCGCSPAVPHTSKLGR